MQEFLEQLEISGCMLVADALNCQKKTAEAAIGRGADCLLCVKDNQESIKKDIVDYVQDKELRKSMDVMRVTEKNRGRIETRTAFVTGDVS